MVRWVVGLRELGIALSRPCTLTTASSCVQPQMLLLRLVRTKASAAAQFRRHNHSACIAVRIRPCLMAQLHKHTAPIVLDRVTAFALYCSGLHLYPRDAHAQRPIFPRCTWAYCRSSVCRLSRPSNLLTKTPNTDHFLSHRSVTTCGLPAVTTQTLKSCPAGYASIHPRRTRPKPEVLVQCVALWTP